ncbi:MAG: ATP-binding cassette domain-containing protein [Thermomicrobiales bacterium]
MTATPSRTLHVRELGKSYSTNHSTNTNNGDPQSEGSPGWALQNLTLDLPFGSLIALLGANGAGKSTFIHLLCGAIEPTTGFVGALPDGTSIGWCSQKSSIDWFIDVFQNVRMGARLAGYDRAESRALTERALKVVGLASKANDQPDMLSGGQQQRVQIARALVAHPDILLLDEPTVGLDVEASEHLLTELRARADAGALVIVSSHDLGLLDTYCDRVLLLAEGRMVAFEPQATFMARFGGEEVLEIVLSGALGDPAIARLNAHGIRVIDTIPLRLGIPRGMPLGTVLTLLEDDVVILDIKRQTPGLRDAYLTFSQEQRATSKVP